MEVMCVGDSARAHRPRAQGGIPVPPPHHLLSTAHPDCSCTTSLSPAYPSHLAPSIPLVCPHIPLAAPIEAFPVIRALCEALMNQNGRAARCAAPVGLPRLIHHYTLYYPSLLPPCPQSSAPCPRCLCITTHSPSCSSCGRRPAGSWRSVPTASGPTGRGRRTTLRSMTRQRCGHSLRSQTMALVPLATWNSTRGDRSGIQGLA